MRSRLIQNEILFILLDGKIHRMKDICYKLEISRSSCVRHINDLALHYNIQTFVDAYNSGVKLLNKLIDINYLKNNELQLIVNQLRLLQSPNMNILKFIKSLDQITMEVNIGENC